MHWSSADVTPSTSIDAQKPFLMRNKVQRHAAEHNGRHGPQDILVLHELSITRSAEHGALPAPATVQLAEGELSSACESKHSAEQRLLHEASPLKPQLREPYSHQLLRSAVLAKDPETRTVQRSSIAHMGIGEAGGRGGNARCRGRGPRGTARPSSPARGGSVGRGTTWRRRAPSARRTCPGRAPPWRPCRGLAAGSSPPSTLHPQPPPWRHAPSLSGFTGLASHRDQRRHSHS